MNALKKILIQKGFIQILTPQIENWKSNQQVDNLELALKVGDFKIRKQAIEALIDLNSQGSIPLILNAIDDKIPLVSMAAIEVINRLGVDQEIENRIKAKLEYWNQKSEVELEKRKNFTIRKKPEIRHNERTSKITYENMKEMIKKPMMGGKWF